MSPKDKELKNVIRAQDTEISVLSFTDGSDDYISLTDLAKYRNADEPKIVIANWMRNRNTIEFLGLWEQLNNKDFNRIEFDTFKNESGANSFTLTPQKWIKSTNSIGIVSKAGRYGGGTYAHKDIAFEFASWLSPEFKLYVIKDYQRLKQDESYRLSLDWNVKRILAKANYKIQTDAVKNNLIPAELSKREQGYVYASEADVVNVALFGQTAAQWRKRNPDKEGNIRDYAAMEQLIVLTNLESMNAYLIEQKSPQSERLKTLRGMAVTQLKQLTNSKSVDTLNKLHDNLKLPNS